jgi:type VI secretion system secreted protein VgrG
MTVEKFISNTYNAALAIQKKYGVNALAAMAQSAQETGWGKTVVGNMYFGIKAGASWTGKRQLLWTHEVINGQRQSVQAWFRAYDTAVESFEDYGKFIASNPRYQTALKYADNTEQYVREIAKAGYATDPNYATSVISIVNSIKKKSTFKQLALV